MAVPAEPNPIPAIEAASIMFPRASMSLPSATARLRYSPPYSKALPAQISDIGLDPWKGGRSSGVLGATRELYGLAVKNSAAWQTTSRPQAAVTSGGIERVNRGSTIPWLGRRKG